MDINDTRLNITDIPSEEPMRQRCFIDMCRLVIDRLSDEAGRSLTFCVTTFGCQMNARDSEKLRGILTAVGYIETEDENADIVVYNTCTVRENANNKVYGRLGLLHNYKKKNPYMKIALCGCMMQEPTVVEKIKSGYKFVDLVFGTHNLYKFAELLYESLCADRQVVEILKDTDKIVEDLPVERKYSFKSGVNIMFGCNNFCSYCIVPYVRGREKSRTPEEIICEVERLAADGVVEVMLLGQNVNSYGKGLDNPITFAQLIKRVAAVENIKRVRFMTSHPKDLSDDLIEAIRTTPKISTHIHLPLQSGSSAVLKRMNRVYNKEQYLALTEKIKSQIPDVSLTTDIIVGFPGETEEDFLETMDVVKRVRYDSAFTFIYSKRTGTPAASYEDQIDEAVVKDRFDRLLEAVQKISAEQVKRFEGKTMEVLVEELNRQEEGLVTGRLLNNITVHFPGRAEDIGRLVNVRLAECKGFYYIGERA